MHLPFLVQPNHLSLVRDTRIARCGVKEIIQQYHDGHESGNSHLSICITGDRVEDEGAKVCNLQARLPDLPELPDLPDLRDFPDLNSLNTD